MSENNEFVPYEIAKEIVGNVIEEEHLHELNRRILTVYDKSGRELCWYDAEDVLNEVRSSGKRGDDLKVAAVEHILHVGRAFRALQMGHGVSCSCCSCGSFPVDQVSEGVEAHSRNL